MTLVRSLLLAFCCIWAGAAAAAPLPVSRVTEAGDGRQKAWHADLDLRTLPPGTQPGRLRVAVDASNAARRGVDANITVALNGLVIGRAWASRDSPTSLDLEIEHRLLSTRNDLVVAVTSARDCRVSSCSVIDAAIAGDIAVGLVPATAMPVNFAQYVARFRAGVAVEAEGDRDRALAAAVVEAMAPHAPRRVEGPAHILVARETPRGMELPLRFDAGPVEIRDREGRLLYDEAQLDALTIVQVAMRGEEPLLWVRPGAQALPDGPIALDHGTVALIGPRGREIAFSPKTDRSVVIAYASDAAHEARLGLYWRLAIGVVWLAATAGLIHLLRRLPPRPDGEQTA